MASQCARTASSYLIYLFATSFEFGVTSTSTHVTYISGQSIGGPLSIETAAAISNMKHHSKKSMCERLPLNADQRS